MPSQLRQRTSRRYKGPRNLKEHPQGLPGSPLYLIGCWLVGGRQKAPPHSNPSRGNCRAVKTLKKSTAIFLPFSPPLENSPLVAPSFPQFPPLLLLASIISSWNEAAAQLLFFLEAAGKLSAAASSFPQLREQDPKNGAHP